MSKAKAYTLFELLDAWASRTHFSNWRKEAVKSQSRCVYVLECRGFYKIGKTADLTSRMKSLQSTNPFEVQIAHVIFTNDHSQVESALHEIFTESRTTGEWFKLGMRDLAKIKSMSVQEILMAAEALRPKPEIKPQEVDPNQMTFGW